MTTTTAQKLGLYKIANLDIANLQGNNTFQIVNDEDPYRRMANIAATLNRSKWGKS